MDLNHSSVECSKLCLGVLDQIPAGVRPPRAMVGARISSDGKLVWDLDLSDSLINNVHIPDADPAEKTHESEKKSESLLQMDSAGDNVRDPKDGNVKDDAV